MDSAAWTAITAAFIAVGVPALYAFLGKRRDARTIAALNAAGPGAAQGSSPDRKTGEERFIEYLTAAISTLNHRLNSLEADRDADQALISELRSRVTELERLDRAKDAYILVLRAWGSSSEAPTPRVPPVPTWQFDIPLA